MLQAGGDAIQVYMLWQGECAAELEAGPLLTKELGIRHEVWMPKAADQQHAIIHLHAQIGFRQAGYICSQGAQRKMSA